MIRAQESLVTSLATASHPTLCQQQVMNVFIHLLLLQELVQIKSLQSHFYLFIISTQLQSPNTDLIFQYQHIGKLLQTLFGGNTQNAELHGPLRRLHLIV